MSCFPLPVWNLTTALNSFRFTTKCRFYRINFNRFTFIVFVFAFWLFLLSHRADKTQHFRLKFKMKWTTFDVDFGLNFNARAENRLNPLWSPPVSPHFVPDLRLLPPVHTTTQLLTTRRTCERFCITAWHRRHWNISLFGRVFRWDQRLRPNGSTLVSDWSWD